MENKQVKFFNRVYNFLEKNPLLILSSLLFLPLVISMLMKLTVFKYASGDTNGWLGFWGSYIGGVISGALTLVGVYLTIKSTNKTLEKQLLKEELRNYEQNFGAKMGKFYEVKFIVYETDRLVDAKKYDYSNPDLNAPEFILGKLNYLIELSLSVDYELYLDVKEYVENIRKKYYMKFDEKIIGDLSSDFADRLDIFHEARLLEKYREVTGKLESISAAN